MKVVHYGRKERIFATVVAALCIVVLLPVTIYLDSITWISFQSLLILAIITAVCYRYFFRNPDRAVSDDQTRIPAPADGIITDVELLKHESAQSEQLKELFQDHDMVRIGIATGFLNVHINRSPAEGKIIFREYSRGGYTNSNKKTENLLLGMMAQIEGLAYPVAVNLASSHIFGFIQCTPDKDDTLKCGEQFGIIRSASRTELYLPAGLGLEVVANVGMRVAAGYTVLAHISPESRRKIEQSKFNEPTSGSDTL